MKATVFAILAGFQNFGANIGQREFVELRRDVLFVF